MEALIPAVDRLRRQGQREMMLDSPPGVLDRSLHGRALTVAGTPATTKETGCGPSAS